MKLEEVLQTYDAAYASSYDDTFLHDAWNRESIAFQLGLLGERLKGARNWLDVACGTGWVLSQFPNVERAGLDVSGPVLDVARGRNPNVRFEQRNYRDPFPEWNDRWDLVTCMWWAYCLAETMGEVRELVARLADWTSPVGEVLVPLCNVRKFDRTNIRLPFVDPKVPGRIMITGVTWTWIQENGKRHTDVMTPQVEYLASMFREHFDDVRIIEGDLATIGEGWRVQDVLSARHKKRDRLPGDLYSLGRQRPPGIQEWLLSTPRGTAASLTHLTTDFDTIRLTIPEPDATSPWAVQVSKSGFPVRAGTHRLRFRARADAPRTVGVGTALAVPPWTGLGLYEVVPLTTSWSSWDLNWSVPYDTTARVHFDAAQSGHAIELADVSVEPQD